MMRRPWLYCAAAPSRSTSTRSMAQRDGVESTPELPRPPYRCYAAAGWCRRTVHQHQHLVGAEAAHQGERGA